MFHSINSNTKNDIAAFIHTATHISLFASLTAKSCFTVSRFCFTFGRRRLPHSSNSFTVDRKINEIEIKRYLDVCVLVCRINKWLRTEQIKIMVFCCLAKTIDKQRWLVRTECLFGWSCVDTHKDSSYDMLWSTILHQHWPKPRQFLCVSLINSLY